MPEQREHDSNADSEYGDFNPNRREEVMDFTFVQVDDYTK